MLEAEPTRRMPRARTPAPNWRCRIRRPAAASVRACSRGIGRHGRDLPWRTTDDPYHILVSEVMLQQTQVDRVLPKYYEWLAKFPSLAALADAPEADVTSTWRPLGYNIRPTRLQSIAREAVSRFGGQLPSDEATLLSFKGIGRYTAGAIRSFAFGERAAILDTNVARVLFRVFVGGGRSEEPRDEAAALARVGGTRAAAARVRLQPGADGSRRNGLHGAEAQVPCMPAARMCRSAGRDVTRPPSSWPPQ